MRWSASPRPPRSSIAPSFLDHFAPERDFFPGWTERLRRGGAASLIGSIEGNLFARLGRWARPIPNEGDTDDPIAMPDDRGHDVGGVGGPQPRHLHQVDSAVGGPLPALARRIE